MDQTIADIEHILAEAVEIAAAAERQAFVAKACAGNADLRAQVEHLLANHDQAGSFLEHPAALLETRTLPASAEAGGTVIGPYKLLQQIGEGGMGTVWMAEQTQPVQRKVALKIIKAGMDSRQVVARFEAERQALALMEHPNIARVFDAGATESGRPYFVMELVKGESITKYCDAHRLTPRQRLKLFLPVCQAIQHAHQKGIIHRDIKSSNVLVAPFDGKPVVKVIDFGIAKATGQRLTDKTLFTEFGAVVGTLEYMSPEQAELNNQDIDTRSDIYSLGVLLYELLTGTTPLDRTRLKKSAFAELLLLIREEEPPKPSARLSESKDSLPSVSAQRQTEPAKLSKLMRGELDWIVMKALDKDRNRRYETANGFAMDLQRYLNDEPVEACPPSVVYRLGKFVKRNRAALATASLLVVMTLVAVGAVTGAIGWAVRNRSAMEQEVAKDRETRQKQLTKDTSILLEEVERKRALIHEKLADPIKVCELLKNVESWRETSVKNHGVWKNACNLAASNQDVLPEELAKRLKQLGVQLDADQMDWWVARELDNIRMESADLNAFSIASRYEKVFRDQGFDWKKKTPAEIAARIQQERLRHILVVTLDHWAEMSPVHRLVPGDFEHKPPVERGQLLETARLADPDPWRDQVRESKNWNDVQALEKLAREVNPASQSPQILAFLARKLSAKKGDARALLRSALVHYPQDYWLHFDLGNSLQDPDQRIGCFQAALLLRPSSSAAHLNLGQAFHTKKDLDLAIQHYRQALAAGSNSNGQLAQLNLALALHEKNDLEGAVKYYRLALGAGSFHTRYYQSAQGLVEKLATIQGVIDLTPKERKNLDVSIEQFHKALELDANDVIVHRKLGFAFYFKKDVDGAIHHFRKSLELDGNNAVAHLQLGVALCDKNDLAGAAKHFRIALTLVRGKKLAENDDIRPRIDTNSRLIFTPPADGTYRLAASAFENGGVGPYTLTVWEVVK